MVVVVLFRVLRMTIPPFVSFMNMIVNVDAFKRERQISCLKIVMNMGFILVE